ncbi:site-specific integrase [Halomonas elongata]|uniref:site-specific integrase n=1 Tax=Halomonas elongata TaxID=2746 RepID=UPI004034B367
MHSRSPKLMDRVKATMRVKRYSPRTEKTYCYWIRFFIRLHGVRHPASMGEPEVYAFLEHLVIQHHVAAATQHQALSALGFLYFYRYELGSEFAGPSGMNRPGARSRYRHLPCTSRWRSLR